MTQENTKLNDFSKTNSNDFISTPIAPTTSAESYKINAILLKDQFSGLPSEDAASHLNSPLSCATCKSRKMWIMIFLN